MRVIQVNKYHYLKSGADRYYFDVSESLTKLNHQVDHLSMANERNVEAQPGDRFVEEVNYRTKMTFSQKARHGLQAIRHAQAARLAGEMVKQDAGEAVVHLHSIYHQLSPSIVGAFARAGVPMVQTLHDYKLICPGYILMTQGEVCERCKGGKYYNALKHRCLLDSTGASAVGMLEAYFHRFKGTYNKISKFLCPSRFMLEKCAEFGIEAHRLCHMPYFLPADRYRSGEATDLTQCVYIGRLSREKGIATLVEAMSRLPEGKLKLKVLGEGPMRKPLEDLVKERCPDRVEFMGYQSGEALMGAIRDAAFCVVPSEWYENYPFAVLEPFALGTPVVGARIGGIPELVREGITGRLHDSGNVDSLIDALLWMTSERADLPKMGREARRVIEDEHGEEAHMARLLGIYKEVMGARP
jgi:glycosyltransferase involved in cell wall biosynthesis